MSREESMGRRVGIWQAGGCLSVRRSFFQIPGQGVLCPFVGVMMFYEISYKNHES